MNKWSPDLFNLLDYEFYIILISSFEYNIFVILLIIIEIMFKLNLLTKKDSNYLFK